MCMAACIVQQWVHAMTQEAVLLEVVSREDKLHTAKRLLHSSDDAGMVLQLMKHLCGHHADLINDQHL